MVQYSSSNDGRSSLEVKIHIINTTLAPSHTTWPQWTSHDVEQSTSQTTTAAISKQKHISIRCDDNDTELHSKCIQFIFSSSFANSVATITSIAFQLLSAYSLLLLAWLTALLCFLLAKVPTNHQVQEFIPHLPIIHPSLTFNSPLSEHNSPPTTIVSTVNNKTRPQKEAKQRHAFMLQTANGYHKVYHFSPMFTYHCCGNNAHAAGTITVRLGRRREKDEIQLIYNLLISYLHCNNARILGPRRQLSTTCLLSGRRLIWIINSKLYTASNDIDITISARIT